MNDLDTTSSLKTLYVAQPQLFHPMWDFNSHFTHHNISLPLKCEILRILNPTPGISHVQIITENQNYIYNIPP